MLKFIQIVAIAQGLFLLSILFMKRKSFVSVNFWLLFATIISILFHIIGDDNFNLFQSEANWYIFHPPLVITLFFLLIKYHNSNQTRFNPKDLFFFTPYLGFIFLESLEGSFPTEEHPLFIATMSVIFLIMIGFLVYTIFDIIKNKKENWMLFFIITFLIVYVLDLVSFYFLEGDKIASFIEGYGIIGLSGLLLYVILFKLVISPKTVLPKSEIKHYKASSLTRQKASIYKKAFVELMNDEKLFIQSDIKVNEVAQKIGISRQNLSEVLNVYMKTSFQDYINKKRAEEFVEYLQNKKYAHYTIMGIANEVGFKSKSSFNTTFKKLYGVTPSEFKKSLPSS